MKTGIPTGLASLLGKLGINVGQGAQGKDGKVAKEALQGGAPKDAKTLGGLIKGAAMADGALLAGLGHAPADRKTEQRNNAEQSNIDRFLQDPQASATSAKELPRDLKPSDAERMRDVREQREETRREDRVDDSKAQAFVEGKIKEDRKTKEEQETRERDREKQKDRDQQQQQQEQDDDHPGGGWVLEEQREEEEKRHRAGVREEDTLGAVSRCRGHLEDGSPCLRKPMQGTPYCREHVVPR